MNFNELDLRLKEETKSEKWHQSNSRKLSSRYASIPRIKHKDREVFYFDFTNDLSENSIKLMKESRFSSIPAHFHKDMELNYIYDGSCDFIINDKKVTLKKGDVCILGPDVIHSSGYIGENDIIITLIFTQEFFKDRFLSKIYTESIVSNFLLGNFNHNKKRNEYLIFHTASHEQLQTALKNLICVSLEKNSLYEELSDLYIKLLFLYLLQIQYDTSLSDFNNVKNNAILEILKYIESNCTHCTLEDIADFSGYSSNYISNLLKEKTGVTYSELKLLQQLLLAEDYLISSNLPVYKIAEKCGFSNLNFFYKKFVLRNQCSPKIFRTRAIPK